MASEAELADLFLTLRAVNAPMLTSFAQTTTAGEEMVLALNTQLAEFDARITATAERLAAIRSEMAAVGAGGLKGAEGVAASSVSTGAATAAAGAGAGEAAAAGAASAATAGEATAAATAVAAAEKEISTAASATAGTYIDAQGRMRDAQGRFVGSTQASTDAILADMKRQIAGFDEAQAAYMSDVAKMKTESAALGDTFAAQGVKAAAANKTLGDTSAQTDAKMAALSGGFLKAGAGAGIAAIAVVKMAGDYEQSTNKLVTSGGIAADQINGLRQGMLDLSSQVGVSATTLSHDIYKVTSAGYDAQASLGLLKNAEQGAKAEGADGAKVADALSSAMRDYYPHAKSAADVTRLSADVMSKFIGATSSGKMTFDELASGLNNILPTAHQTNIALSDVLGVLASMTVHGISVQQATENINHAMLKMQGPTGAMSKAMATLGIDSIDVQQKLGQRGLSGTLEYLSTAVKKSMPPGSDKVILDLGKALSASTPKVRELGQQLLDGTITYKDYTGAAKMLDPIAHGQAAAFATLANTYHQLGNHQVSGRQVMQTYAGEMAKVTGDATTLKVALQTTGENADYTNTAIKNIAKSTADAHGNVKGWAEVQGTFNQKMSEAKAGLDALAISVGEKLLPYVTKIASAFAAGAQWIGRHKEVASALAAVLGVVMAGAIVTLLGKLASFGLSMAKNLISPITGSIKFVKDFAGGLQGAEGAADSFGGKLGSAASSVGNFASSMASAIANGAKWVASTTAQFAQVAVSAVGSALRATGAWISNTARMAAQTLAQAATWVVQTTAKYAKVAFEASVNALAASASWLKSAAVMVGQGIAQAAIWMAGMIAKFVAVAASAVVSGAAASAAWIAANIAMIAAVAGIALVVAGLIALVILIIKHWHQIEQFFQDLWKHVSGFFSDAVRDIGNILGGMARFGEHMWDWLSAGLKGAVNGVISGIDWMIDRINGLIHGINNVSGVVGIPAIPDIPHVPHLAMGGVISGAGLALVGESGRELVTLPTGASVLPNPVTEQLLSGGGGQSSMSSGGSGGTNINVQVIVHGSVQTENNLVRAVQQGILQLSGRNPGFGTSPAFA